MQYQQDVLSAIEDLTEAVNSRQKADSALDMITDLSVYEEFAFSLLPYPCWYHNSNLLYIRFTYSMVPKRCKPVITLKPYTIYVGTGTGAAVNATDKFVFNGAVVNSCSVSVQFYTADAATIAAIKSYGINSVVPIVADCRGRL